MTPKEVFTNTSSFGTTLLIAAIDMFGTACFDWDPSVLRADIEDLTGQDLHPQIMDRLMAAISVLTSDLPFVSLTGFNNICNALNFSYVSGNRFIPAGADDIMWGCTEMRLLLGAEAYDNADWSHDVRGYVGTVLSEEGITVAPDIIGFAEFNYREIDNKDMILAGDAEMAATYQQRQTEQNDQLNKEALNKMSMLLNQIGNLKLVNGDTSMIKKLEEDINRKLMEPVEDHSRA